MIRTEGIEEWRFNEFKDLLSIDFFAECDNERSPLIYVTELASGMQVNLLTRIYTIFHTFIF